jgi:hypothetical protein
MKTSTHFYQASTPSTVNELINRNRSIQNNLLAKGKAIVAYLIKLAAGSSEPQISEHSDRQGNIFWRVYDPISQTSARFSSEMEVRIWLDQRYSR